MTKREEIVGHGIFKVFPDNPDDLNATGVLMDVQMPGMDGLEATSHICEVEKETGGHTCIIALTANVRQEDREKCLAAGMDGFVTKPMSMGELDAAVRSCF